MQYIVTVYQLQITIYALLFGAAAAAVYDCVKIVRMLCTVTPVCEKQFAPFSRLPTLRTYGKGRLSKGLTELFSVHVLDILYSLTLSAAYCVFLFAFNNGRFRWYLAAAALCGFVLYRLSVSRLVMAVCGYIVYAARRTLAFFAYLLWQPLRFIYMGIRTLFSPLVRALVRMRSIAESEKKRKQFLRSIFPQSDV